MNREQVREELDRLYRHRTGALIQVNNTFIDEMVDTVMALDNPPTVTVEWVIGTMTEVVDTRNAFGDIRAVDKLQELLIAQGVNVEDE